MAADAIIGPTIDHLRRYCPPFAGRVAGAADFTQGLENYNTSMPLPAAYVVPLAQEADPNENLVGYFQIVREIIAIVVELDATPDRRGQAPMMVAYDEIKAALCASLLNWAPAECRTPNRQGYQLTAGRKLDLDRARLFYQFEFLLPWQLTEEDGWQEPEPPIDLVGIELDIYTAPPFEMPPPDGRPPAVIEILPMSDQPVEPPFTVQPVEDAK